MIKRTYTGELVELYLEGHVQAYQSNKRTNFMNIIPHIIHFHHHQFTHRIQLVPDWLKF
jgi:hypothetical protein